MLNNKKLWVLFVAVILVEAGATEGYILLTHKAKPQVHAATVVVQKPKVENTSKHELIDVVQKQVELPTDEEPILASVSNPDKLKNQNFFTDAHIGDILLMYPRNKKVFLYRPSIQQVLAQAPLRYDHKAAVAGASQHP
jgi:hypothetical protein